jgi:phospholipid-transporting ATPase
MPVIQGMSPDAVTLVDAANRLGMSFKEIYKSTINYEYAKHDIEIEKKFLFEFNSDRKRESLIIRDTDGKIKMYMKGADKMILERLDPTQNNPEIVNTCKNFVEACSQVGLRTLMVAMKIFDTDEFQHYVDKMREAELDINNKTKLTHNISEEMEKDLFLIGCTAVEDKLQTNVPETLRSLHKAGICVWMLTGDKLETAESIGKSCNLIPHSSEHIERVRQDINDSALKELLSNKAKENLDGIDSYLIIEMIALSKALGDRQTYNNFIKYSKQCKTVICSRCTPSQKADVVRAIKSSCTRDITLAIGDGANDVSMILEANIGVGIYGKEGMRAVQSADFAVGEFQCLWPLLLKHGRISYIRNSEMILYFFLKNLAFTMPQFFFCFWCAYSGQTFYEDMLITLYNLVFTSLPLGIKALFDVDIHQVNDMQYDGYKLYPYLYQRGQYDRLFTFWIYTENLILGLIDGAIVFFFPLYFCQFAIISYSGRTPDLWLLSVIVYTSLIIVAS